MGNMDQFALAGPVTPLASPPVVPDAPSVPRETPKAVEAVEQKIKDLGKLINELATKDGMKPDDPMRLIHVALSVEIEEIKDSVKEIKQAVKAFGPDSGRIAGESAAEVMRQNMGRFFKHMGYGTIAVGLLGAAGLLGVGVWGGYALRGSVATQVAGAAIPRAMAERFPYQRWGDQWDARQTLPADKNGTVWAWVPMVETMAKPPKR